MAWRSLLVAAACFAVAGCGFELRRPQELHFQRVQLTGFAAKSPLAAELTKAINATGTTRVVAPNEQPQVVIEAVADGREINVVDSTAAALVRDLELNTRLSFRVHTPAGKEFIALNEILQTRDLSYNEGDALAKEQEEALLYEAMQADIVSQVMRRLAAIHVE